jgi:ABC-type dipeptide/oligopeptide/nickel transport system permease component
MKIFILKRAAFLLPQLFLVAIVVFLLLRALPIDPVSKVVGLVSTEEARELAKQDLGLDVSLAKQLGRYLEGLVTGDLGTSWSTKDEVRDEIAQRFPVTLQLTILAFTLALLIAIPIGRIAASRPNGRTDKAVLGYSLFAGAQPDFWWGLLFIFIFFFKLGWFPAPIGLYTAGLDVPDGPTNFMLLDSLIEGQFDVFVDVLKHLALPVMTLAFVLTGPLTKMTRQGVVNVVNSDYMLYAKAAGLPKKTHKRYLLRNSLAPVITLGGILFGFMLGGAVLIETVFTLDGLGLYALRRMLDIDFPAVQGAVVVMTAFALLVYLIMDIIYAAMDPRIRLTK